MLVGPVVAGGDKTKGTVILGVVVPVAEDTPVTNGNSVAVPVVSVPEFVDDAPDDAVGSGPAVTVPVVVPVAVPVAVPVIGPIAVTEPLASVPVGVGPVVSVEPPIGFGMVMDLEEVSVGVGPPVTSVGTVTIPVTVGLVVGRVTMFVPVGMSVDKVIGTSPVPVSVAGVWG